MLCRIIINEIPLTSFTQVLKSDLSIKAGGIASVRYKAQYFQYSVLLKECTGIHTIPKQGSENSRWIESRCNTNQAPLKYLLAKSDEQLRSDLLITAH